MIRTSVKKVIISLGILTLCFEFVAEAQILSPRVDVSNDVVISGKNVFAHSESLISSIVNGIIFRGNIVQNGIIIHPCTLTATDRQPFNFFTGEHNQINLVLINIIPEPFTYGS